MNDAGFWGGSSTVALKPVLLIAQCSPGVPFKLVGSHLWCIAMVFLTHER